LGAGVFVGQIADIDSGHGASPLFYSLKLLLAEAFIRRSELDRNAAGLRAAFLPRDGSAGILSFERRSVETMKLGYRACG
jgi:hypothetical protein